MIRDYIVAKKPEVKMTKTLKVLLSLYKSQRGLTWGQVTMIKGMWPGNAYGMLMSLKQRGFVDKSPFYKNKFIITDAGIKKLKRASLLIHI